MTQKRPCDDELLSGVSLKHHRSMKQDDYSTSHLEFVPSEEVSDKRHASGEGGFVENHLEDEEITTNGFSAPFLEVNKDNDVGAPRSLSLSPWATNSTSEEDETHDLVVQLPFFPEYFSFDRPVRSPLHADDLYRSLLDYPPRKSVSVGPEHQADVPEMSQTSPSRDVEDKLAGICIIPRTKLELPLSDSVTIGGGRTDCNCADIGSVRCVRQHIMEAREKLMTTLGEDAFVELGFGEMGEVVAEKWSQEEEILFHKVVYCNPVSAGKNFWNALYSVFPSRSKMDIVSYYFNVFMLRKRAEQNRYDPINIDSDDDEWQLIDDDGFDAEKTDEEDNSAVESPLCHEDDDVHESHPNCLNEHGEDPVEDFDSHKDLNCKADENSGSQIPEKRHYDDPGYNDTQDGSCTSSDSGAPAQIPHENLNCGKDWHEIMLEPCDPKAWNGYSCCPNNKVDFLPTCSMIEEVFGDETLDSQVKKW